MIDPIISNVRVIGFDADDTLWHCESYFRSAEENFTALLAEYGSHEEVLQVFYREMVAGLPRWGYGVKSATLAMLRTALVLSHGQLPGDSTAAILAIGEKLQARPVELFDGVPEVLALLRPRFRLWLITKGDLLDQEQKIAASGLAGHFEHIEIVSEKTTDAYAELLRRHQVEPAHFLMIGNSPRSDIRPVLELGGHAVFIPSSYTWSHEHDERGAADGLQLAALRELPPLLGLSD